MTSSDALLAVQLKIKQARRLLRSPAQLKVADDPAQFKALLCGRRAGKTIEDIFDLSETLAEYPGDTCAFIELTRPSARNKVWRPWKLLSEQHGWGLEFSESTLQVRHNNGAACIIVGANTDLELDKIRGLPRLRRAIIDECGQQKPSHLQYLAEEVLEPGLMDVGGGLRLSGTPGLVPVGYWYDVTTAGRPGWSVHRFTAFDNPFIDAKAFIEALLLRRGWTEDNPIFQREYLGLWTFDVERRVYAFDPARNVVDEPEQGRGWSYVLTHDYGHVASTAWAILGYPQYGDIVYVLKSFKRAGLAPSEAADISKGLVDEWEPDIIVGDLGGLGKAYAAELVKRHGIAIKAADKSVKRATIEFQSDAMRIGKLVSVHGNDSLHAEWKTLQWNEERDDFAEGQDDHESEAVLYGWRECPAYANMLKEPSQERDGQPAWVDRDDDPEPKPEQRPYWETDDEF